MFNLCLAYFHVFESRFSTLICFVLFIFLDNRLGFFMAGCREHAYEYEHGLMHRCYEAIR